MRESTAFLKVFLSGFFVIFVFFPLAIGESFRPLTSIEILSLMLIGLGIAAIFIFYPNRKMKEYKVKDTEWIKLYSYGINNSLAGYFESDSSGMKKKHRKKALEYSRGLLYAVETRWRVGSFSLVESYRNVVSDFRMNVDERIVHNVQKGDDDRLKTIRDLMYNLFYNSDKLGIKDLEKVNEDISSQGNPRFLESRVSSTMVIRTTLGRMKFERVRPYLTPLFISLVASGIVWVILAYLFGSNLAVASVTVVLFGCLLAFLKPDREE